RVARHARGGGASLGRRPGRHEQRAADDVRAAHAGLVRARSAHRRATLSWIGASPEARGTKVSFHGDWRGSIFMSLLPWSFCGDELWVVIASSPVVAELPP